MRIPRSFLIPLALVALLGGCNNPGDDAAPATAPATAPASDPGSDADVARDAVSETDTAASGYVLDMDKVRAYFDTLRRISRDPAMAAAAASGDDDAGDPISMDASESVDAYIARLEANAEARRLVTLGGMSVADFAHTNSAMLEGMMTAGMMEATGATKIPDGINPQYVEFARIHKAELEQLAGSLSTGADAD
jgi:hypothetical protein